MSNLVGLSNQISGRRQTITHGSLNATGFPNAITTTSGLSCTITATSAVLAANFAAGFNGLQPVDFPGTFSGTQVFSALTANTTHFFYLERNAATGVVTIGNTAIAAPIYSAIAPTSPVTGQHWFKTSADSLTTQQGMTMYEWSGSAWIARQRVFLGEVVTSASAVTNIANYAHNRQYLSDWVAVTANISVAFAHNLGVAPADIGATLTFYGRVNGSDANPGFAPYAFYTDASTSYGILIRNAGGRLSQTSFTSNTGTYFSGSWLTTCQIRCAISSPW